MAPEKASLSTWDIDNYVPALITWVYNNTRSVVAAILMHVAANVTFNYLPLLPEFTEQMTTFWLFLGVVWLVFVVVVILFGPSTLMRKPSP